MFLVLWFSNVFNSCIITSAARRTGLSRDTKPKDECVGKYHHRRHYNTQKPYLSNIKHVYSVLKLSYLSAFARTETDIYLSPDILCFNDMGIQDHISAPLALCSDLKMILVSRISQGRLQEVYLIHERSTSLKCRARALEAGDGEVDMMSREVLAFSDLEISIKVVLFGQFL